MEKSLRNEFVEFVLQKASENKWTVGELKNALGYAANSCECELATYILGEAPEFSNDFIIMQDLDAESMNELTELFTAVLNFTVDEQDGYFDNVTKTASYNIIRMLRALYYEDKFAIQHFGYCLQSKYNILEYIEILTVTLLETKKGKFHPWWSKSDVDFVEKVLEALEEQTGCTFRGNKSMISPEKLERFFVTMIFGLGQLIEKIMEGKKTVLA